MERAGFYFGDTRFIYKVRAQGIYVKDVLGDRTPYANDEEVLLPGGIPGSQVEAVLGPDGWIPNPYFKPDVVSQVPLEPKPFEPPDFGNDPPPPYDASIQEINAWSQRQKQAGFDNLLAELGNSGQ